MGIIETTLGIEVFKIIWYGIVALGIIYMITDTVTATKRLELKAMIKMEREERKDEEIK